MFKLLKTNFILIGFILLAGCSGMGVNFSAGDKYKEKEYYRQAPPSLNPETAFITSTVVKQLEKDDHFLCTIRIEKVNEMGPGTPPLPKGRQVSVILSKNLLKKKSPEDMLKSGKILIMTLKAPDQKGKSKNWHVIKIH